MKEKIKTHWLEFVLGMFFLFLALFLNKSGISSETSWIIGVFGTLISLSIIIIKIHIGNALNEITNDKIKNKGKLLESISMINDFTGFKKRYANHLLTTFHKNVKSIKKGVIELSPSKYFDDIEENIKNTTKGDEVFAIYSIDEKSWEERNVQKNYLIENIKASERGVKINRIFILDKERILNSEEDYRKRINVILEQVKNKNINIHIIWSNDLKNELKRIRDWVLFCKNEYQKLYEVKTANSNGFDIEKATLFINEFEIKRAIKDFNKLLKYEMNLDEFKNLFSNSN